MYIIITQRALTSQHSPRQYPTTNASEEHREVGDDFDPLPSGDAALDTSYPNASRSQQNAMQHSDPYDDVILVNVSQNVQVGSMDAHAQPRDPDYRTATFSATNEDDATKKGPSVAIVADTLLPESPARSDSSLSPRRQQKKPAIIPRKRRKENNFELTERPFLGVGDVPINVQPRVVRQPSTARGGEGEHSGEGGRYGSSSVTEAPSNDGEGRRRGGETIEGTAGGSEQEYGRGGGKRGGGGGVYVGGGGGRGGEIELTVHKLGHSQSTIALHTSLVPQTPSTPPTPNPRPRVRFNMTPAYSTDDVEVGGHGTLRVKRRERSVSTPHNSIDLSTIYYTDV